MFRFLLTRVSLIVPTFLGMTLVAFMLIRLVPGDPIETLAGERGIDPARHAALLKEYGLDRPLLVQYGIYIGRVLRGDLGNSIITHEPVLREFLTLFPATIELALAAISFALLLGIPAGILDAVRRNSILDHGVMGASLTGYSMPIFWWGPLLILLHSGYDRAKALKYNLLSSLATLVGSAVSQALYPQLAQAGWRVPELAVVGEQAPSRTELRTQGVSHQGLARWMAGEVQPQGLSTHAEFRAGVGKATIYRRWSSKAELLLGVLDVVGAPVVVAPRSPARNWAASFSIFMRPPRPWPSWRR